MAPRNKAGRPRAPKGEARDKHIGVYVRPQDAESFEQAARRAGFESVSAWAADILVRAAQP